MSLRNLILRSRPLFTRVHVGGCNSRLTVHACALTTQGAATTTTCSLARASQLALTTQGTTTTTYSLARASQLVLRMRDYATTTTTLRRRGGDRTATSTSSSRATWLSLAALQSPHHRRHFSAAAVSSATEHAMSQLLTERLQARSVEIADVSG